VGKRNERLERLIAESRELLRTIRVVVGGLRQDPVAMTRLGASLVDAIQNAGDEFDTLVRQIQEPPAPTSTPPRRRGPGRPKRLPAAEENHQGAAAEPVEVKNAPS